jgi:hypothetical protein
MYIVVNTIYHRKGQWRVHEERLTSNKQALNIVLLLLLMMGYYES